MFWFKNEKAENYNMIGILVKCKDDVTSEDFIEFSKYIKNEFAYKLECKTFVKEETIVCYQWGWVDEENPTPVKSFSIEQFPVILGYDVECSIIFTVDLFDPKDVEDYSLPGDIATIARKPDENKNECKIEKKDLSPDDVIINTVCDFIGAIKDLYTFESVKVHMTDKSNTFNECIRNSDRLHHVGRFLHEDQKRVLIIAEYEHIPIMFICPISYNERSRIYSINPIDSDDNEIMQVYLSNKILKEDI